MPKKLLIFVAVVGIALMGCDTPDIREQRLDNERLAIEYAHDEAMAANGALYLVVLACTQENIDLPTPPWPEPDCTALIPATNEELQKAQD